MRSTKGALVFAIAMLLTGCAGAKLPASVSGGIDKIFPEPPHEIRGATPIDQRWIDETIEAGSTCCAWQVKPRPAALDAPPPPPAAKLTPKPPPKKKPLWKRLRLPSHGSD